MSRPGLDAPFVDMAEARVRIRPMYRRDLPTVVALETALFHEEGPWDLAQYEEAWTDTRMVMLVVDVGGEFAGYGFFEVRGGQATIHALAVSPKHQGRGVGRHLLAAMLRRGERRGVDKFVLQVRVGNEKAKALYESFRFAVTTVRHNYYRRGLHAEEMVRHRRRSRQPGRAR
jgi:ribosomal-protein-alanine N-acetyltransferase